MLILKDGVQNCTSLCALAEERHESGGSVHSAPIGLILLQTSCLRSASRKQQGEKRPSFS